MGASTGALPLAVVDAIPGDLEGPRGGGGGAKFPGVSITLRAAHGRRRFFACCQLRYGSAIVKERRFECSYAVQSSAAYSLRAEQSARVLPAVPALLAAVDLRAEHHAKMTQSLLPLLGAAAGAMVQVLIIATVGYVCAKRPKDPHLY